MMEKLKYTKFKTLLISSFICISIIPVVLLGLFIFHLSKQELIRQSEKQMWQILQMADRFRRRLKQSLYIPEVP